MSTITSSSLRGRNAVAENGLHYPRFQAQDVELIAVFKNTEFVLAGIRRQFLIQGLFGSIRCYRIKGNGGNIKPGGGVFKKIFP
ncbi:MAG: hypothetical protein R2874_13005 [Desulfobacterales bacterium]